MLRLSMLLRWCVSASASLCTRTMLDVLRLPCRRLGILRLGRHLQFECDGVRLFSLLT
jgi:hypothetical protein